LFFKVINDAIEVKLFFTKFFFLALTVFPLFSFSIFAKSTIALDDYNIKIELDENCSSVKNDIKYGFNKASRDIHYFLNSEIEAGKLSVQELIVAKRHLAHFEKIVNSSEVHKLKVGCELLLDQCGHARRNFNQVTHKINITPKESCLNPHGLVYFHELFHLLGDEYTHNLAVTQRPDYTVACTYRAIGKLSYINDPKQKSKSNKLKQLCFSDINPFDIKHIRYFNDLYEQAHTKNTLHPAMKILQSPLMPIALEKGQSFTQVKSESDQKYLIENSMALLHTDGKRQYQMNPFLRELLKKKGSFLENPIFLYEVLFDLPANFTKPLNFFRRFFTTIFNSPDGHLYMNALANFLIPEKINELSAEDYSSEKNANGFYNANGFFQAMSEKIPRDEKTNPIFSYPAFFKKFITTTYSQNQLIINPEIPSLLANDNISIRVTEVFDRHSENAPKKIFEVKNFILSPYLRYDPRPGQKNILLKIEFYFDEIKVNEYYDAVEINDFNSKNI
jgi:hypothetical protein